MKKLALFGLLICFSIAIMLPVVSWADEAKASSDKDKEQKTIEVFKQMGMSKSNPDDNIDRNIFIKMDEKPAGSLGNFKR